MTLKSPLNLNRPDGDYVSPHAKLSARCSSLTLPPPPSSFPLPFSHFSPSLFPPPPLPRHPSVLEAEPRSH